MSRGQAIFLGVLGAAAAALAVAAVVLMGAGGGPVLGAAATTVTSTPAGGDPAPATTAQVTVPAGPSSTAPAPPETAAPPVTAAPPADPTTTTTLPGPVPPDFFPPGVVRAANPVVHVGFDDPDCDGLVLEYAASAPRELRLPGEPTARVRTAVIVDLSSEPGSLEEAEYSLEAAGGYLYGLTGFGFEMTEYVEARPPEGLVKEAIADCYLQTVSDLPDHVILFSNGDNDTARVFGGYATFLDARSPVATWAPAGWANRFTNTSSGGVQMYVSVIHWGHRFGRCGYGGSDTVVSAVAVEGECRGRDGTECVSGPDYQVCPDELSNPNIYPANFRASSIVHELMHPFGRHGNGDHYGGPDCSAEMGWAEGTYDEEDAALHHQMCPYTYEAFVAGFTG